MVLCEQVGSTSDGKNTTTNARQAGQYLDVFETPMHDENGRLRKLGDWFLRKNLKDLFDQKETGLEQPEPGRGNKKVLARVLC